MQEFDLLASIIEEKEEVTRETLISKTRKRPIVELRMVCSNILRKSENNYTLNEIGSALNIDHATVCHYSKVHTNLMRDKNIKNGRYRKIYEKIFNLYEERAAPLGENVRVKLMSRRKKLIDELKDINQALKELDAVTAT